MGLATISAMVVFLGALGQTDKAPSISDLIKDLSAPSYAKRESATEALRKRGKEALKELKEATSSEDPETSQRAADLIKTIGVENDGPNPELDKIKKTLEDLKKTTGDDPTVNARIDDVIKSLETKAASKTKGTEVTLNFEDATMERIAQAIQDQTGITVLIGGAGLGAKKITIKEEKPMPFWKAIDRLCELGGMVTLNSPNAQADMNMRMFMNQNPGMMPPIANPEVVLTPGQPLRYPTDYSGSHCVRLIKIYDYLNENSTRSFGADADRVNFKTQNKNRSLELAVQGVPGNRVQVLNSGVSFTEFKDEQGRNLALNNQQNPNFDQRVLQEQARMMMMMRGGNHFGGNIGPNGASIQVPILNVEPNPKTIKILKGTVPCVVIVPQKPITSEFDKALGQKFETKEYTIEIKKSEPVPNSKTEVLISFSVTAKKKPEVPPINMGFGVVPNNDFGFRNPQTAPIQILDQNNQTMLNTSSSVRNDGVTMIYDWRIRLQNNQSPKKILIRTDQVVTLEIPFEFRDIPFPQVKEQPQVINQ